MFSLIGVFIRETLSAFFGSIWDRIFPKKTVEEQKQRDLAVSATAALAVEQKINQAASSSPQTVNELKSELEKDTF